MTKQRFVTGMRSSRHWVHVNGIGETAFAITGPVTILDVYAHGRVFEFQVLAGHPIAGEEHLARLVLARLG